MKARQALNLTPANSHQGFGVSSSHAETVRRFFYRVFLSLRRCAILVLTRKLDEKIIFDIPASSVPQQITLNVNEIRADKVRLGIIADRSITIDRKEIADSKAVHGVWKKPERPEISSVVRIGERLPGELMRRKV